MEGTALGPCIVDSVRGNRARLRRLDGTIVEDAHLEDMVVVPEEATNIERTPLNFEDDEVLPIVRTTADGRLGRC